MSKPWAILIIGNPKRDLNIITIYSTFWSCTFWGPGPWKEHCTNIGPNVPFEVPIYGNSGTVLFRVLDLQGFWFWILQHPTCLSPHSALIYIDPLHCQSLSMFQVVIQKVLTLMPRTTKSASLGFKTWQAKIDKLTTYHEVSVMCKLTGLPDALSSSTRLDLNGQQQKLHSLDQHLFPVQGMGANWSDRDWIDWAERRERNTVSSEVGRRQCLTKHRAQTSSQKQTGVWLASVFDKTQSQNTAKTNTSENSQLQSTTPSPRGSYHSQGGWVGKNKVITWNAISFSPKWHREYKWSSVRSYMYTTSS